MKKFLDAYGSVNAAAEAWGVEYVSLKRFVDGTGGLTLATAMRISDATGVATDDLFVHEEEAAR